MVVPLVAFRNDVMVWHSEMSGVFKKAHATYICCMVGMVGMVGITNAGIVCMVEEEVEAQG